MMTYSRGKRINGRFTEERFLDFELAHTLMESGYANNRTLAFILGARSGNISAIRQWFANFTEYRNNQARHRTNPETDKPFKSRSQLQEYQAKQRTNPETGKPFESLSQERDYQARHRTNPETGKPFESLSQYLDYHVRQRGFASAYDRRALINNPAVLIIAALKDSGRPLSIDGIHNYIAENFNIRFRKIGKLERTIELANRISPEPLFVEQAGLWSLNLGNRYLEEVLGEGVPTQYQT